MTKNTAEPWNTEPCGNLKARQFVEAGEFRIVECLTRDQHANARRIVACVNACAGISTEALHDLSLRAFAQIIHEALGSHDISTPVRAALDKLRGET